MPPGYNEQWMLAEHLLQIDVDYDDDRQSWALIRIPWPVVVLKTSVCWRISDPDNAWRHTRGKKTKHF